MPAKRNGCLGKILAVLFTSVIAPVLTNLLTEEVANWQEAMRRTAESEPPAAAGDWSRPAVEDAKPAPVIKTGDRRAAPNAFETPRKRLFGEGERAAAWGRMLGR